MEIWFHFTTIFYRNKKKEHKDWSLQFVNCTKHCIQIAHCAVKINLKWGFRQNQVTKKCVFVGSVILFTFTFTYFSDFKNLTLSKKQILVSRQSFTTLPSKLLFGTQTSALIRYNAYANQPFKPLKSQHFLGGIYQIIGSHSSFSLSSEK